MYRIHATGARKRVDTIRTAVPDLLELQRGHSELYTSVLSNLAFSS